MINAERQTYLTQTGPRINGRTSGITSQKRKAEATGEITSGGDTSTTKIYRPPLGIRDRCWGSETIVGDEKVKIVNHRG
jgi:hypothetical protein